MILSRIRTFCFEYNALANDCEVDQPRSKIVTVKEIDSPLASAVHHLSETHEHLSEYNVLRAYLEYPRPEHMPAEPHCTIARPIRRILEYCPESFLKTTKPSDCSMLPGKHLSTWYQSMGFHATIAAKEATYHIQSDQSPWSTFLRRFPRIDSGAEVVSSREKIRIRYEEWHVSQELSVQCPYGLEWVNMCLYNLLYLRHAHIPNQFLHSIGAPTSRPDRDMTVFSETPSLPRPAARRPLPA